MKTQYLHVKHARERAAKALKERRQVYGGEASCGRRAMTIARHEIAMIRQAVESQSGEAVTLCRQHGLPLPSVRR